MKNKRKTQEKSKQLIALRRSVH